MSELLAKLTQVPALHAVGIGLVLQVVGVLAALWWKRKKAQAPAPAQPAAPQAMTRVWSSFVRGLPKSVRGAPVTLLVGPRRTGKSSTVVAVRQGRLTSTSATDDPRLALYFGDNQLVIELGADVWQDARAAAVRARRALVSALAWQTPVVTVVVDPTAADATPEGLADVGRRLRALVDDLNARRSAPVELRVVLTHLDVFAPGFSRLFTALEQANAREAQKSTGKAPGVELPLTPAGAAAQELSQSMSKLAPYWTHGLTGSGFADVVAFAAASGPQVLERLSPLLDALIGVHSGVASAQVRGIYLAAMPVGAAPSLSGDPFAVTDDDVTSTVTERRRVARTRWITAGVAAAAVVAALAWVYRDQGVRISDAETAAANISSAGRSTGLAAALEAERTADTAVDRALSAPWPPLAAAYPQRKDALRTAFTSAVRDTFLLPRAREDDAARRALALGVIYAARGDSLASIVTALPRDAADRLGVPAVVTQDYLERSPSRWTVTPTLPTLTGARDTSLEAWSTFLSQLDAALRAATLTEDALVALQTSAADRRALVDQAGAQLAAAQIAGELRARALPVDTWLGAAVVSLEGATWVHDNASTLRPLLTMVQSGSLAVPAQTAESLVDALATLDAMVQTTSTSSSAPRPPVFALGIEGRKFQFDSARWQALLESSRAARYLDEYMAAHGDETQMAPELVFARSCVGSVGGAAIRGRGPTGSIPCQYTREVLSQQIVPRLSALDRTLDRLDTSESERRRITAAATAATKEYAAAYGAALSSYYGSYQLTCSSADTLAAAVNDLLTPTSYLTQFLQTVAENASVGDVGDEYLAPVVDATADFASVVTLMTEDKGKYPLLAQYYAIILPTVPSLTVSPPGTREPGTALANRLSPLGRLALEFVADGETSPRRQARKWLDTQGVPPRLRAPFMAPLECAYKLGIREIEAAIATAYVDEILPATDPLLWRFPFDRRSPVDASGVDVQAALGPKGAFAQTFTLVVSPVVDALGQGRYQPKIGYAGKPVALPAGLLDLATYAAQLRGWLWGEDGRPRSIPLIIQPQPLRGPQSARASTLASLRAGKTTLFAFNQTPAWQPVAVSWGLGDSASVALRSANPKSGRDSYHSLDADPSDWAFYRLLTKASTVASVLGTVTAVWRIPTGTQDSDPQSVSFVFQSDPWQPFAGVPQLQ